LASLLRDLTDIRQIVFRSRGRFGGMASPSALLDGMALAFPVLDEFRRKLSGPSSSASSDTQREILRQTNLWLMSFGPGCEPSERQVKVGVRSELLCRWLGERLVDRCVEIDEKGLTMVQVQQIVDSLILDVPLARQRPGQTDVENELQVICRDMFALALAREWVRSSLPRLPTR
jgi:hypothetical protein